MYEDFNYITDDSFLSNYWWQEKVMCQHCQGKGKSGITTTQDTSLCHSCEGTGRIKRSQQKHISAA